MSFFSAHGQFPPRNWSRIDVPVVPTIWNYRRQGWPTPTTRHAQHELLSIGGTHYGVIGDMRPDYCYHRPAGRTTELKAPASSHFNRQKGTCGVMFHAVGYRTTEARRGLGETAGSEPICRAQRHERGVRGVWCAEAIV